MTTEFIQHDNHIYLAHKDVIVAALSQKGNFYSTNAQGFLNDETVDISKIGLVLKGRGLDGDKLFSKFDSYFTIQ